LGFVNDPGTCEAPDAADKGVELAMGQWVEWPGYWDWIPLAFYINVKDYDRRPQIRVGEFDSDLKHITIRGYSVPVTVVNETVNDTVEVCDFGNGSVQFRWLATSRHKQKDYPVDVWTLDDVYITLEVDGEKRILLEENFTTGTSLR